MANSVPLRPTKPHYAATRRSLVRPDAQVRRVLQFQPISLEQKLKNLSLDLYAAYQLFGHVRVRSIYIVSSNDENATHPSWLCTFQKDKEHAILLSPDRCPTYTALDCFVPAHSLQLATSGKVDSQETIATAIRRYYIEHAFLL